MTRFSQTSTLFASPFASFVGATDTAARADAAAPAFAMGEAAPRTSKPAFATLAAVLAVAFATLSAHLIPVG